MANETESSRSWSIQFLLESSPFSAQPGAIPSTCAAVRGRAPRTGRDSHQGSVARAPPSTTQTAPVT